MNSGSDKRERGNSLAPANERPTISQENDNGGNGVRDKPKNQHQTHQIPQTTPDSTQGDPMVTDSQGELKPQGLDILGDHDPAYGIQSVQTKKQASRDSPPRDAFRSGPIAFTEKPTKPNATFEPPVTKGTLSELDVNKIVHNPRLRHDINFDPDLHFRPNLDGEKGLKKSQKSGAFWDTMRQELQDYMTNREGFEAQHGENDWTLPATLRAIRGILETLVPQRDRASVEETFNVDLLMQQFRMGVADLVKLSTWLSQLLKCHCAPMRDDWVDEMVMQLSNGDRNGDVALLVTGMHNLLGVLEAMKLDVANHQIRCLRPLLIEDTVHFEQKYFMKKIAMGKLNLAESHAWYERAGNLPNVIPADNSTGNSWNYMKALVYLSLPSRAEAIPPTFAFDEDRVARFRGDMQDLINLEICMHMYRGLEAQNRQEARQITREGTPTTMSFTSSPFDRPTSPADNAILSSPTIPLPHHFNSRSKHPAHERGHFIRTLTGRQIWIPNVDEDPSHSSSSSSPRSSPESTASNPAEGSPPTPFYLSVPIADTSAQARTSLQAILASLNTPEKWSSLSPSMALEILRLTNTSLTRLPQFESHLGFHISNTNSRLYQEAEQRVLQQLFPALQKIVVTYTPLTSNQVFEIAVAPKTGPGSAPPQMNGVKEEMTEVATRMAHMGVLHWRVWAPLAYLVNPNADEDTEFSGTQTTSA